MRTKFALKVVWMLPAIGILLTGCSDNHSTLNTTNRLPPDPAVDRSDVETLTKAKAPAKPQLTAPSNTSMTPTAAELDVPFYPGAKPYTNTAGVTQAGMKMAILETGDSQEKVAAFYKQEMPHAEVTKDTEDGQPITRLSEPSGKNGVKAVSITTKDGKTQIIVTNISEESGLKSDVSAPAETKPSTEPQAGNLPPH